jgi:hypothetical protein
MLDQRGSRHWNIERGKEVSRHEKMDTRQGKEEAIMKHHQAFGSLNVTLLSSDKIACICVG